MKITSILAVSLLCLTAGAAFADGDGPFGVPQSPNSLPKGFLNGSAQHSSETATNAYLAAQASRNATTGEIKFSKADRVHSEH